MEKKRITYLIGGQIVQGFPTDGKDVKTDDAVFLEAIAKQFDNKVVVLRDVVIMREGIVTEAPFMVVPLGQIAGVCYPHVEQMSLPEFAQEKLGLTPEEVAKLMGH